MALAIYNGLLKPAENSSALSPFDCQTGNCTFPSDNGASDSSLAVCHETHDITSSVLNHTSPWWFSNYSLPSGAKLVDLYLLNSIVPNYSGRIYGTDNNPERMLFTFEALMHNYTREEPGDEGVLAVRSSIDPCVKTWGANIPMGQLMETEVDVTKMDGIDVDGNYFHFSERVMRQGTWEQCDTTSEPDEAHTVMVNSPSGDIDAARTSWCTPDCIWLLDMRVVSGMQKFLSSRLFHKNVTVAGEPGPGHNGFGDLWLQNLFHDSTASISTIANYMAGLAASMTANIRARGDPAPFPDANHASGTLMENQTCVHVRWRWIALPATLVLCSTVFLTATILLSMPPGSHPLLHRLRQQAPGSPGDPAAPFLPPGPLKSSPLPYLFHGVDPHCLLATGTRHPENLAEMETAAEGLRVRIGRPIFNGNWCFYAGGKGASV